MAAKLTAVLPLLLSVASAQQIGTSVPEVHPKLMTMSCTANGGCTQRRTALVTDSLSRPLHVVGNPAVACDVLNKTQCPDAVACSKNCALEGIDYSKIGVSTSGDALTMNLFMRESNGTVKKVSPRLYLLAEDDRNYELLKLVNQEFTYDVDMSKAGCGVNGALYLSEMEGSGSRSDANPAGAQYGTGYCDAQCFNTTFINGLANFNNSGACCNEMDIWEANNAATQLTPHPCTGTGSFLCSGPECNKEVGVCDKNGCSINPFSAGAKDLYGVGKSVDTTKPFTVVTQFLSSDNSSTGTLSEIRRLYIQNGRMINTAQTSNASVSAQAVGVGSITEDLCTSKNASSDFVRLGGVDAMGESLARGMVLIFSIWNDDTQFMNWLDSGNNGPCSTTQGDPKIIAMNNSDAAVVFSNIRWGDIGSTVSMSANGTMLFGAAPISESENRRAWMGGLLTGLALVFGVLLM